MRRGLLLRAYLALSRSFPLVAPALLRRRLARGKEHPDRWREKVGLDLTARPDGKLIWLNAVGLGEVLSLRGLIARMAEHDPDTHFMITSTTRASAEVIHRNMPPRTFHQFLPIDAPRYRRRFLDHFHPDLCVWAEQDLWPGFVNELARRDIPQAMVAARMNDASYRSHVRARALFRDLYGAMKVITAQDSRTAANLKSLGAADVTITGSLKPGAPVLACDAGQLSDLQTILGNRFVWAVAPSHPADEDIALAAHRTLREVVPGALLIIVPRYPERGVEIAARCDPKPPLRSSGERPGTDDAVWICDTFGELGLVYRLCMIVLIGGTFSDIEGHNPWEAAALNTAIAHGPRVANFANDYAILRDAEGAIPITTADDLSDALMKDDLTQRAVNAQAAVAKAAGETDALAARLMSLVGADHG
ncbi:3-deoxy-D-manno-octulosonic acid transferase [Yoonia sp. 2307UL14-13]|uniref:3-deoxy-D-manno-octulosonic acid transferase n=1 Tax=Yoonia sp. 2307UL14-13 TaxID=3126506 RepID=UPI0030AE2815